MVQDTLSEKDAKWYKDLSLSSDNKNNYDLSFMYTTRCDLSCSFCMYNSSPEVRDAIDLDKLKKWLDTVDMNRIASFGVYGGEVSVDYDGFSKCFDLVSHLDRSHFVITNGTWSTDLQTTKEFLEFSTKYNCYIVVSGTPEHRRHQNRKVLEDLKTEYPEGINLKPKEEGFHAMGRLEGKMKFSCSRKCIHWDRASRIAIQPNGEIIFQNCDGIYPVVGTLDDSFSKIDKRITNMKEHGFYDVCSHFNFN